MRVAMFQEIIAPYRVPVFNDIYQKGDFQFKVFFLSETQNERLWSINSQEFKFPFEVLPGFRWEGKNLRALHFNFGVLSRLMKQKFDCIVTGGWHQPSYYLSLLYAKTLRKKFLFWSESHAGDLRLQNPFYNVLRGMFVRWSSGAIVAGEASKQYLLSLGVKPGKIWTAPNAIDAEFYQSKSRERSPTRERLKKEKKLPEKNLLYVGRLVREKGVHDLLQAYARLVTVMPDLGLLLCGEGNDRASLQAFCRTHNLKNVLFLGFLQREALIPYYLAADVFVLPSHTEPWGLVVNEAMTCGLPVICSSRVGAARDLVHAGENGFIFEPGRIDELCGYLRDLLPQPERIKRFGEASKRIIQNYSPARCAEGFIKAIREV